MMRCGSSPRELSSIAVTVALGYTPCKRDRGRTDPACARRDNLRSSMCRLPGVITVKVSRKHQISVPAAVRRQLGIRPGDRLRVEVDGSRVILQPQPNDALTALLTVAPDLWRGVDAAEYLRELREE